MNDMTTIDRTQRAYSAAAQMVMPVICLAIVSAAPIIKQTRAIALEVMVSDPVRYGRACGLPPDAMRSLVLRNSAVPVVTFVGNMASLIILALGGHFVINGSMSLGDFTAFSSYLSLLIFPIMIIIIIIVKKRPQ